VPTLPFHQVEVFTATPLRGNPLAVVHGAAGLDARPSAGALPTALLRRRDQQPAVAAGHPELH
jgi:hypothetical protein